MRGAGPRVRRVNDELIRAGFYRVVQPRCFGGYEFDVPTFYRVMMEIARGCPETGWVLALTAGHPLIIANFPLEGQRDVYGPTANSAARRRSIRRHARCRSQAAIASPPRGPRPRAAISARIISAARWSPAPTASRPRRSSRSLLDARPVPHRRRLARHGHAGHRLEAHRRGGRFRARAAHVAAVGVGRGNEPAQRPGLHANPLYLGRIASFLIGEAAVVRGRRRARRARSLRRECCAASAPITRPITSASGAGIPVALRPRARPDRDRRGGADPRRRGLHGVRARGGRGGAPFDDEKDLRLLLIEQQAIRLAWDGMELIYRTVGTSDAARDGATIGRIFRNMAVINTHPALQLDRTAINAAHAFGLVLQPPS
jgi:3-hydroxy-9,10-secoandrosta-1,3,5(10)-triene-9,17-dione monooxygenase